MYKVVKAFADLQDNYREYCIGDIYPREGLEVTKERIAELSGYSNKQGQPVIEEVKKASKK